jgi:hypothetical protein
VPQALKILLIISLAGLIAILFATKWGAGLSPDSLAYIKGATSLLAGRGFTRTVPSGEIETVTHWPPLYSSLLALFGLIGIGVEAGARWLGAFLFGTNIFLVGYIIYRETSVWPSFFGSFLVLSSPGLIAIHSMAWTEALYITFGLLSLMCLTIYIERDKVPYLLASAFFIAVAALTRYIGVSLIATACLGILIFGKKSIARNVVDCLILGGLGSFPLLAWLIRNRLVARAVSDIQPALHPVDLQHLRKGIDVVSIWILPERVPFNIRVPVFVLVLGLFVLALRKFPTNAKLTILAHFNILYVGIYCLTLAAFISFVSLDIQFNSRYLAPILVSLIYLTVSGMSRLLDRSRRRFALTVLSVLFCVFSLNRAISAVNKFHRDGLGLEGREWVQSETINYVKTLPEHITIYSNAPIPISMHTGRNVFSLPAKFNQHTNKPYLDYEQRLSEIGRQDGQTVIVYLKAYYRSDMASEDELQHLLTLKPMASLRDGVVYDVKH